ncbi:MAG: hypothetical protein J7K04_11020, partial [Spirochaetales bacterium]|nr:hypothetical protein [Spirochaetales bacterium]
WKTSLLRGEGRSICFCKERNETTEESINMVGQLKEKYSHTAHLYEITVIPEKSVVITNHAKSF